MSGLASLVKQTMVALSDAVAQMMLIVVPLQEANAPMAPELPSKIQVVAGISVKMSDVADNLGKMEYDNFPTIQKEIFDASQDVRDQVNGLHLAIRELGQSSDRKKGWDILVNSCSAISTKTILLLKIVYGIETKRILAHAKTTLAKLGALDPELVNSNPKQFAADASDMATALAQLAEYNKAKAADSDLPEELQEDLRRAAEAQAQAADDLITATNNLLKDRNNPELKRAFAQAVINAKNAVKSASAPVRILKEQLDTLNGDNRMSHADLKEDDASYDPNHIAYNVEKAKEICGQLGDPSQKELVEPLSRELEAVGKELEREGQLAAQSIERHDDPNRANAIRVALEAIVKDIPVTTNGARNGKDISGALNRLLDALNKLKDLTVAHGDEEGREQELQAKLLKDDLDRLEQAVVNGSSLLPQLAQRVVLRKTKVDQAPLPEGPLENFQSANLKDLGADVSRDLQALKGVMSNPNDHGTKEDFHKANVTAKGAANQVLSYAKPSFAENMEHLLELMAERIDDLARETMEGDKPGKDDSMKELDDLIRDLQKAIQKSVNATSDPARKKSELEAWKRLEDALNKLVDAAKPDAKHSVEPEKEAAKRAVENLRDATSSKPLADARQLNRATADLVVASARDERPKIAEAVHRLIEKEKEISASAKEDALKTGNPEKYARVQHDLDNLEELIAEQVELANKAIEANNTHDKPEALRLARELLSAAEKTDAYLDDLTSVLKPGVGHPHADVTQPREEDLPPHLKVLLANAAELEGLLPELVQAAKRAHDDPAAFIQSLEKLRDPLNQLFPHLSDEDRALALADNVAKHVDNMVKGAKEGDQNGLVSGARMAADTKAILIPLAREIANKAEDPKKAKEINDAIEQLEALFPKVIALSKEVLNDPKNSEKRKALQNAKENFDDSLKALTYAIGKTPEEIGMGLRKDLGKALRGILTKVNQGDKKGALQDSRQIANTNLEPFSRLAEGNDKEADLKKAIDRLGEILRDLEREVDADRGPGSEGRKNAEKMVKEAEDIMDNVLKETSADVIHAIKKEQKDLENLQRAKDKADSVPLLQEGIREIVADHRALIPQLKEKVASLRDTNEGRAKELENAVAEMEGIVPVLIQKTKATIVNPDDSLAKRELGEACAALNVPLIRSNFALTPSSANHVKLLCRAKDLEAQGVSVAKEAGDSEKLKDLRAKLKDLNPLKEAVKTRANELRKVDPRSANEMEELLAEIVDLIKAIDSKADTAPPEEVNKTVDKLHRALLDLEGAAEGHTKSENAAHGLATLDDIICAMKGPLGSAGRLNMDDLLKLAQDLSSEMSGMVGKVKEEARDLSPSGHSAASLVDELKRLEALSSSSKPQSPPKEKEEEVKVAAAPVKEAAPPTPVRPLPPPPPADAPFHERVSHVAASIDHVASQIKEEKGVTDSASELSSHLMRLAEAAKSGDRKQIIVEANLACASINKLVLELQDIAKSITDKRMRERLLWLATMMKDLSTNMKILCSVKAASGTPDNDDQIVSVITSIHHSLTQATDVIAIATKTKKRKM